MGHIYFELPESEVPEGSHSDGDRVYMLGDIGRSKIEKIYIGVYARKDELPQMFYPNENFNSFLKSSTFFRQIETFKRQAKTTFRQIETIERQ
jgi:hypothetical protein